MRRIVGVLSILLTLVLPSPGGGTQERRAVPRVAVLSGGAPDSDGCLHALRRGLAEYGYTDEGRTHELDVKWTNGAEATVNLVADLLRKHTDVLVSFSVLSHAAAKQATSTTPIIMANSSYPVETGLVRNLRRPGANLTGMATLTSEIVAKRLQLLAEAVPTAKRIAVLRGPGRVQDLFVRDAKNAAARLGVHLEVLHVSSANDIAAAFGTAARSGAKAVMATQSPLFGVHTPLMAQLGLRHRMATLSGEAAAPEAGVLLFYGPNVWENCRQAAKYVDRVLRGANAGDLPIEQPTKLELVVNIKTARALGLTIPPVVLVRADRVIE